MITPTRSIDAAGIRRVIVIDDDPAMRDSLKLLLATRFEDVHDYESAEAFLEDGAPGGDACLIVDVNLPGIDGIELVGRLAAAEGRVRAVLISGRYDEAMRRRANHVGVADLLEKPVALDELLAAIVRTMDY